MPINYKNNPVINAFSFAEKVIQKRIGNNVVLNLPSITFTAAVSSGTPSKRPNAGSVVWTFDKTLDYIVGNYNIGDNINLFKKVTNATSISKSLATDTDNNGSGNGISVEQWHNNRIYLPATLGITKVTVSNSGSYISSLNYSFNELFPDLITFEIASSTDLNFDFLNGIPLMKNISMRQNPGSIPTNLSSLKNHPNLQGLYIKSYNPRVEVGQIIPNLPTSLYYFRLEDSAGVYFDLKDYFTGSRIGLYIGGSSINYSGGAIFPKNIKEKDLKIDAILRHNNSAATTPMSSDAISRFIVDFANQVETVELTTGKLIRIMGGAPNTSYTDNSQPLYKTYTAALNHITSTLGITVSFT